MHFDPRLHILSRSGSSTIWRVDGAAIRNCLDVEFTTSAHIHDAAYVPCGQLWIDREAPRTEEWRAWAARGLYEIAALDAGVAEADVLHEGALIEKQHRRRHHNTRKLYVHDLGAHAGLRIRLVHGCYVRDHIYLDFVHGGHGQVYEFIPLGEIWIDDVLTPHEFAPTITHEIFEMQLMERGLDYDVAHERASSREATLRSCHNSL